MQYSNEKGQEERMGTGSEEWPNIPLCLSSQISWDINIGRIDTHW